MLGSHHKLVLAEANPVEVLLDAANVALQTLLAQVEVLDDVVTVHAQARQEQGCDDACAVLSQGAKKHDGVIVRVLEYSEDREYLPLGVFQSQSVHLEQTKLVQMSQQEIGSQILVYH